MNGMLDGYGGLRVQGNKGPTNKTAAAWLYLDIIGGVGTFAASSRPVGCVLDIEIPLRAQVSPYHAAEYAV